MNQKSLKKNTIYNALKTASSILFPLITFPYISRVLLPENVGKINFGASIESYFSLIAGLGVAMYAIRECSTVRDDKEKLSDTASQIFSINVITTLVAYIALFITLVFCRELDNYQLLIIIQSLTIATTTWGADWINTAMEDFKYITVRTILFQIISLVLMFIFVRQPTDYLKYAIITLISSAGASVTNIWYRRKFCNIKMIWNVRSKIEWSRHVMPIVYLFVMQLAQTIFGSIDKTMLGLMHGDWEVGIYSTAIKMNSIIFQIVSSILWVILPRMSYYFEKGDFNLINQLLKKILAFHVFLGIPSAVGTFMMSDELVFIISGSEYAESANILRILMIHLLFYLFGASFLGNSILLPSKKEKSFMIVCSIAAIANAVTNYIFIPRYGVTAAAWTTVMCAIIIFIILAFTIDKRIKIEGMYKLFITPIIGSIAIVAICLYFKQIDSLINRTIVSILLSVVGYLLINYVGGNELLRVSIKAVIRKIRN